MGLTRPKSSAGLVLGRHSAPDPHPRGTPARHHGGARATSPTRPGGRHHRRQYYRKHIDEPPSSARTSISKGTSIAGASDRSRSGTPFIDRMQARDERTSEGGRSPRVHPTSHHAPGSIRRTATNCAVTALEAGDGAIRLPGSSHAEAALAGRGDVLVVGDVRVVEAGVERGRLSGGDGGGRGRGYLARDGRLEEARGGADEGEDREDGEVGAGHGRSV